MTGLKLMSFVVIKLVRIMSREILNVYFMRKVSYAFRAVRALANVVVIIFMFQEFIILEGRWKILGNSGFNRILEYFCIYTFVSFHCKWFVYLLR